MNIALFVPASPFVSTTVSMVETLLPSINLVERKRLDDLTKIKAKESKKTLNEKYAIHIKIAQLFLRVTQEAAKQYVAMNFKKFDALVRNFGCQITALEIVELANLPFQEKNQLLDECERIQQSTARRIVKCMSCLKNPIKVDIDTSLLDYLSKNLAIDLSISPQLARLAKIHMLCLINARDKLDNPITKADHLFTLIEKENISQLLKDIFNLIVGGSQAEESKTAAEYIRKKAKELPPDQENRSELIRKCLSNSFTTSSVSEPILQRKKTAIVSVPLLYNTETVVRSFSGTILVTNKLDFAGKIISGSKPIHILVKMPDCKIITEKEVPALSRATPLLVIEGYIIDKTKLIDTISQIGLVKIIQSCCLIRPTFKETSFEIVGFEPMPQYASGVPKEQTTPFYNDPEIQKDISEIQSRSPTPIDIATQSFVLDHIFCSTIEDEVPV